MFENTLPRFGLVTLGIIFFTTTLWPHRGCIQGSHIFNISTSYRFFVTLSNPEPLRLEPSGWIPLAVIVRSYGINKTCRFLLKIPLTSLGGIDKHPNTITLKATFPIVPLITGLSWVNISISVSHLLATKCEEKMKKVLIIGSGLVRIGQTGTSDDAACRSCEVFKKASLQTVMVHCDPSALATDGKTADRTYVVPLTDRVMG